MHLACKDGLDEVTRAEMKDTKICKTCPHYLHFTSDVYKREDGRNFALLPTDQRKKKVKMRFGKASSAVTLQRLLPITVLSNPMRKIGAKTILQRFKRLHGRRKPISLYVWDAANRGRITFNKAVELCSTNVAKIFGCAPQKYNRSGKRRRYRYL